MENDKTYRAMTTKEFVEKTTERDSALRTKFSEEYGNGSDRVWAAYWAMRMMRASSDLANSYDYASIEGAEEVFRAVVHVCLSFGWDVEEVFSVDAFIPYTLKKKRAAKNLRFRDDVLKRAMDDLAGDKEDNWLRHDVKAIVQDAVTIVWLDSPTVPIGVVCSIIMGASLASAKK